MTAAERRLLRAFRALDESGRQSLLDYSEFLIARVQPVQDAPSQVPLDIPRPAQESVVKAIKRLRETYPMVDRAKILHETSGLMTQHLVHGRPPAEIIDELERMFRRYYDAVKNPQ